VPINVELAFQIELLVGNAQLVSLKIGKYRINVRTTNNILEPLDYLDKVLVQLRIKIENQ
jgi:hypothetical protein